MSYYNYSNICLPGSILLRYETDKEGSVLSNKPHSEKTRDTCTDITHIRGLETGSIQDPALTCSLWMTTSLTIMMLMRFPTLGSLYTAATYNKDETQRQKMQTSTNLNRQTNLESIKLVFFNSTVGMRKYICCFF